MEHSKVQISGPEVSTKISQVEEQLSNLMNGITRIDSLEVDIRKLLTPVLRFDTEDPVKSEDDDSKSLVPLADTLYSMTDQLYHIECKLVSLLHCIEL